MSVTRKTRSARLPGFLKPLFWEYDFARLRWDEDRDLVIRRVLVDGTWPAVCWLRNRLGDRPLARWILDHQGRGLSPQQLRFWELILKLPRRQVTQWIERDKQLPWNQR